ncbi:hypothetical protein GCM10008983_06320 [Lentibacillus halophilus]|uniref:Uncharacterized protein n=1 Tax=Lentibacillus halophilus TaxID=295065 RepID=A0ABP3IXY1_9BACI
MCSNGQRIAHWTNEMQSEHVEKIKEILYEYEMKTKQSSH